jgi:uncharacterized protein YnzC (UPF0291/DUF896 family)
MPHAVPLSDTDSSGPLVGSLTALSLTETPETETVDTETSQYNPFVPYFVNEAGTPDAVHSIDQLTRDVIPRHLAALRQTRRFELAEHQSRATKLTSPVIQGNRIYRRQYIHGWISLFYVLVKPGDGNSRA